MSQSKGNCRICGKPLKLSIEGFIGPVPVSYEMEFVARIENGNLLLNNQLYIDVTETQAIE